MKLTKTIKTFLLLCLMGVSFLSLGQEAYDYKLYTDTITGKLNLEFEKPVKVKTILITDSEGNPMKTPYLKDKYKIVLDVRKYESGTYIILLSFEDGHFSKREYIRR